MPPIIVAEPVNAMPLTTVPEVTAVTHNLVSAATTRVLGAMVTPGDATVHLQVVASGVDVEVGDGHVVEIHFVDPVMPAPESSKLAPIEPVTNDEI